jgi:hypothetical protein
MKYINKAKIQKLVMVNKIGQFVQPGEVIELTSDDIKQLRANSFFIVPLSPETKKK